MGEMMPIPQGPNMHCGNTEPHDKHPTTGAWCDGVPPLEPFVELVVRVPLTGDLAFPGEEHALIVQCILDDLPSYVFEEMYPPTAAKSSLRVRAGGEDRVYPLRYENGDWHGTGQ